MKTVALSMVSLGILIVTAPLVSAQQRVTAPPPAPTLAHPVSGEPTLSPSRRNLPAVFVELAESSQGLSFEELWNIAIQHDPGLRQKRYLISAARGGELQAGLYPNPTLTYAGDNLGVNDDIGKHGFTLSQEIVTAKKKKLDRSVASYDIGVAQREYSMECQKLQNKIRIATYEVLHAQLAVRIERFGEKISIDVLDTAQELHSAGKVKKIDVLQFRTNRNESALAVRQAENDYHAAWKRLATILGTPDFPVQPVRGSLLEELPEHHWEASWAVLRQTSPELAIAQLRARQARVVLARQEAERCPNFTAAGAISQDIPANTTVPFVAVSVPLKIYDRNQGNIQKAKAEVAASNREVERVMLTLHKELTDIFRDYENARELTTAYESSIIPDTLEALAQVNKSYQVGEGRSYLELYNQRHNILETLRRYIDSLKAQLIASTLIDGLLLKD